MKIKPILILTTTFLSTAAIFFACKELDLTRQVAIKTTEVINITTESAIVKGEILDLGEGIIDHGVYYHTEPNAQNGEVLSLGAATGVGEFTTIVEGLQAGVTYYTRTFGFDGTTYVYGEEKQFAALDGIATITTNSIENITAVSAACSGSISEFFGSVVERGICYSYISNPTVDDFKIEEGSGIGAFTCSLSELSVNTLYYVRAYAFNGKGLVYGNEQTFLTLDGLPTLKTIAATNITAITATSGGNIIDDGGFSITARGICWSKNNHPTIENSFLVDGIGIGEIICTMTSLTEHTTYFVRAYATNINGTAYGNEISFETYGAVVDIDGNTYKTVIIGEQEWMAENLKVTHYSDGIEIPLVTSNSIWSNLDDNNIEDAFCYYNNNVNGEKYIYGALYTFAAAKKACPTGWHLPSDAEWTILVNFLITNGYNWDSTIIEDKIAKSLASSNGWNSSSREGAVGYDQSSNNRSRFTALPGGTRGGSSTPGTFDFLGNTGYWWSSTAYDDSKSYYRYLYYNRDNTEGGQVSLKSFGISVRCVKD
ncbi:MAG: FISUMP domain-containing protein [Salinivirgaceae bacterium]|jgi:uncharacterized protein (TIGR02145 family)|nr:FISUMP domain-containing protein [Salinivirgaceae bacterium]